MHFSYSLRGTDSNLNNVAVEYSFADLYAATDGFSVSHKLGSGSYGSVYRGTLRDGSDVAIKQLKQPKEGGFLEEKRRESLSGVRAFKGGDLATCIAQGSRFDFKKRLSVLADACLGLSYLHNATPRVYHRDIKPQNILIGAGGVAKVADFGLALLASRGIRDRDLKERVAMCGGTMGYADPLYIETQTVSEKSDVYSFGIVMLECLTGRPPLTMADSGRTPVYTYARVRSTTDVVAMLDPLAGWNTEPEVVRKLASLALACIGRAEHTRPTFAQIVRALRTLIASVGSSTSTGTDQAGHLTEAICPPAPLGEQNSYECVGNQPANGLESTRQTNPFASEIPARLDSSTKGSDQTDTVEAIMNTLFEDDKPESSMPCIGPKERSRFEIARRLRSAGFSREQVMQVLSSCDPASVEAAVEWIVEQGWSSP